jgi:hypothetical protein
MPTKRATSGKTAKMSSQPAKALALYKPASAVLERLDLEPVLAVEQPRNEQPAEPPQLSSGRGGQDRRLERHRSRARRFDPDSQL